MNDVFFEREALWTRFINLRDEKDRTRTGHSFEADLFCFDVVMLAGGPVNLNGLSLSY
jgi:hypothetical protein